MTQFVPLCREEVRRLENSQNMTENDGYGNSLQNYISDIENDTHYNIRIPEVKTLTHPIGLEYTVIPIRDDKTNKPILYENSMEKLHIIKILEPANWEYLLSDKKYAKHIIDYQNSPIKVGEYYFCKFINIAIDNKFSHARISSSIDYCMSHFHEITGEKLYQSSLIMLDFQKTAKMFSANGELMETSEKYAAPLVERKKSLAKMGNTNKCEVMDDDGEMTSQTPIAWECENISQ
jgi:hypothetical protein